MKYIISALILAWLASLPASAQSFSCRLTPTTGYTGVTPTQMSLDFDSSPGEVIITDDIGPKIGRPVSTGEIDRWVGQSILFGWTLRPIPQSLKPPTETKFYESTVIYKARVNTTNGKLTIVGNFVTRVSSANTGLNMRATGQCK